MDKGDILKNGGFYCKVLEVGKDSVLLTSKATSVKQIKKAPRRWYTFEALEENGWEVYEV